MQSLFGSLYFLHLDKTENISLKDASALLNALCYDLDIIDENEYRGVSSASFSGDYTAGVEAFNKNSIILTGEGPDWDGDPTVQQYLCLARELVKEDNGYEEN